MIWGTGLSLLVFNWWYRNFIICDEFRYIRIIFSKCKPSCNSSKTWIYYFIWREFKLLIIHIKFELPMIIFTITWMRCQKHFNNILIHSLFISIQITLRNILCRSDRWMVTYIDSTFWIAISIKFQILTMLTYQGILVFLKWSNYFCSWKSSRKSCSLSSWITHVSF